MRNEGLSGQKGLCCLSVSQCPSVGTQPTLLQSPGESRSSRRPLKKAEDGRSFEPRRASS